MPKNAAAKAKRKLKKKEGKKKKTGKPGKAGKSAGKIKGRGDYTLGNAANHLIDAGKNVLGFGISSFLGSIFGRGAYDVSLANTGPARFAASPDVIIAHREFVGDVGGSQAFTVNTFTLNPTNPALFPWLSGVAVNWDQYEWVGILLEYRATSSFATTAANTALGTVIMATDYNLSNAGFSSKVDMENYEGAVSCPPDQSFYHMVECARKETTIEVMYTNQNGNDQRFTSLGDFQIATTGMQGAYTIGELWVTYKIKLMKPKLQNHMNTNNWVQIRNTGSSITSAAPLGTGFTVNGSGAFGDVTVSQGMNNWVIYLEPTLDVVDTTLGSYNMVVLYSSFTSNLAVNPVVNLGTALTTYNWFANKTLNNSFVFDSNVTSTGFVYQQAFQFVQNNVGKPSATVQMSQMNGITGTANTYLDIVIYPISSGSSDPGSANFGVDKHVAAMIDRMVTERTARALRDIEEKVSNTCLVVDECKTAPATPVGLSNSTILNAIQSALKR